MSAYGEGIDYVDISVIRNIRKHTAHCLDTFVPTYRVFFIEGQIRISCKMLKISLFHVGSGLRTEVTMGDLISDQIKSPFYVIDAHINLQKLQL